MADPLSITGGVLTIVGRSLSLVQTLHGYVSRYQTVNFEVSSLLVECSSVRTVFLQIHDLLDRNLLWAQPVAENSTAALVLLEYDRTIGACVTVFSILNERLEKLDLLSNHHSTGLDFVSRLNYLWREEDMDILRQRVQGVSAAINLLLTAFSSGTIAQSCDFLQQEQNYRMLKTISDSARSLRASTRNRRPTPGPGTTDTEHSIIGDEDFEFDEQVINTSAYRRVLQAHDQRQHLQPNAVLQMKQTATSSVEPFSVELDPNPLPHSTPYAFGLHSLWDGILICLKFVATLFLVVGFIVWLEVLVVFLACWLLYQLAFGLKRFGDDWVPVEKWVKSIFNSFSELFHGLWGVHFGVLIGWHHKGGGGS